MKLDLKKELRIWTMYFLIVLLTIYIHEVCHCIPVWMKGIRAIPTPAKEYILKVIPDNLQQQVSLGGILGTVLISVSLMIFYLTKRFKYNQAVLAGAIAMPGVYTFLFLLTGRGHDATEFQEAQAALGAAYSGHLIDWGFLVLFIIGAAIWILKSQTKPKFRIAGRLLVGSVLTLIFIIALQTVNNVIFDPIFK